jgi:hypothetical protein
MLRRVALVRTDISEELSASFIRVTRIGELGTILAVPCNRRTLLVASGVSRKLVPWRWRRYPTTERLLTFNRLYGVVSAVSQTRNPGPIPRLRVLWLRLLRWLASYVISTGQGLGRKKAEQRWLEIWRRRSSEPLIWYKILAPSVPASQLGFLNCSHCFTDCKVEMNLLHGTGGLTR